MVPPPPPPLFFPPSYRSVPSNPRHRHFMPSHLRIDRIKSYRGGRDSSGVLMGVQTYSSNSLQKTLNRAMYPVKKKYRLQLLSIPPLTHILNHPPPQGTIPVASLPLPSLKPGYPTLSLSGSILTNPAAHKVLSRDSGGRLLAATIAFNSMKEEFNSIPPTPSRLSRAPSGDVSKTPTG